MAAQACAVGMGAVPWSRAVGAASARLDGVGLDAALSWKLTAVMEQTTTEVTFPTSSIIFYLFFSLPYLFHFCLFWQIVHSIHLVRLFLLPQICLIVPTLHPSVLSQSCWDSCRVLLVIIILNINFCVCFCVHAGTFLQVCISVFLLFFGGFFLITANCLICMPPARIKSKHSKPCRLDFCVSFSEVFGDRWKVCVAQSHDCVVLPSGEDKKAARFLTISFPSQAVLQYITSFKNIVWYYSALNCTHSFWAPSNIHYGHAC